jgi:hypothetical protein
MSEEKRVINLDPKSLKIPDGKTRRRREPSETKIRIKSNKPERKQRASTLKRNFLNIIRANQERLLKDREKRNIHMEDKSKDNLPVKTSFEESVQFLQNLPKEPKPVFQNTSNPHSHRTFKNYHNLVSSSSSVPVNNSLSNTAINIPMNNITPQMPDDPPLSLPYLPTPSPPYGVLKNGTKPTYRTWRNLTQRAVPVMSPMRREVLPSNSQLNYEDQLKEKIKELSEQEQRKSFRDQERVDRLNNKHKKQKRTIRRTYRIGKSKVHPRVSILVGNKTIRNNTNLKKTELKEKPITEVKRFLRKAGFIKIGTTTPNDVLRQMYENVNMICGEVQNHNSENLLYNYFNDTEDSVFE